LLPQGTRSFPSQGTIGGPQETPPITQFGDGGTVLAYPLIFTPDPHGEAQRFMQSAPGDRQFAIPTGFGLQIGAAPGRILRPFRNRISGVAGAGEMAGGLPFDGSWRYLQHQKIERQALSPKRSGQFTDDNAPIPAVYAGDAR
jgi:hypothetical protein